MFLPDLSEPDSLDNALYLVFDGEQLLSDPRSAEPCLLPRPTVRFLPAEPRVDVFLGYWKGQPCFARDLESGAPLESAGLVTGNLYTLLGRVPDGLFALAGRAQQLIHWQRENRYCGRCGGEMQDHDRERARVCGGCEVQVYPRISPCIIVLVHRGAEMLLARNASFPGDMYSTLAGFIEAGETVEECLVREVKEEVGVDVHKLRYFSSQSWPFPNQLMLGFFAEYAGGEIVCDDEEIAEAYWFTRDALPTIPPASSVAGQLIRHHIDTHS